LSNNYNYDIEYYQSDIDYYSLNDQISFWRDKLKDYDKIVLITLMNSTSQNTNKSIPKIILKVAKEENKDTILCSSGLPYDVANYRDDVDVITACYGNRGHDVTDPSSSSLSYGPNIPSLIDVIFGYCKPEGYFPVDAYKINPDGSYDFNEIIYPFGWRVEIENNTPENNSSISNDFNNNKQIPYLANDSWINLKNTGVPLIILLIILFLICFNLKKKF
jgi:hypothetical protein